MKIAAAIAQKMSSKGKLPYVGCALRHIRQRNGCPFLDHVLSLYTYFEYYER